MRILGIETATEACSVALFENGALLDYRHEILGRGHAERLVPMIASLPNKGGASEIRVSLGPGSFTGVRIGLATARALGIAWGAKVTGYPTLALVAAMARHEHDGPVTVCMNGGHGQWFVQRFNADGQAIDEVASQAPDHIATNEITGIVAGNRAEQFAQQSGLSAVSIPLVPDARSVLHLPGPALTADLAPIYGRPPDAKAPGV